MNMHPNSTAPADDQLQDLDLSRSGHNAPEVVELDCATATIFGEIDGGGEPCSEESLAAAEILLEDDTDPLDLVATEWVNRNADLRHLSSAEQNVIDEIDQLAAEPSQGINLPLSDVESIDAAKVPEMSAAVAEVPQSTLAVTSPSQQTLITGLPEGFSLRADGVYVVGSTDKADEEVEEEFLCSPLRVIDLFRERDGSGWGRRIVITNPEGRDTTITVLNEVLEAKGRSVLSQLVGLGLRFGRVKKARETVLDLLMTWNPDKLMLSTNRQGWADEACEAFVLGGGRLIGDPDVVSVNGDFSTVAEAIQAHGTLEDWKANVAALCVGNPLMTTAMSLAFVGPLLELLGRDGGGLHLRGQSSRGKTTLQRSAASVWGMPTMVQSWRTTDNALEATAAGANGMLLVLDELGVVLSRFGAAPLIA